MSVSSTLIVRAEKPSGELLFTTVTNGIDGLISYLLQKNHSGIDYRTELNYNSILSSDELEYIRLTEDAKYWEGDPDLIPTPTIKEPVTVASIFEKIQYAIYLEIRGIPKIENPEFLTIFNRQLHLEFIVHHHKLTKIITTLQIAEDANCKVYLTAGNY